MGCGRSKVADDTPSTASTNTAPVITPETTSSIDESKNGITFNENGTNIVVRFTPPVNSEGGTLSYSLINNTRMIKYTGSVVISAIPGTSRLKYVYANSGCTYYSIGESLNPSENPPICTPRNSNDYMFFAYLTPLNSETPVEVLRITKTCGVSGLSQIRYTLSRFGVNENFTNYKDIEGFTEMSKLLDNTLHYAKFN